MPPLVAKNLKWVSIMYNKLIATYATIFPSTSSPFCLSSNIEDHRNSLCNDTDLVKAFTLLRIDLADYCKYFTLTNSQCNNSLKVNE